MLGLGLGLVLGVRVRALIKNANLNKKDKVQSEEFNNLDDLLRDKIRDTTELSFNGSPF
jgi:hypothetical protein